MAALVPPDFFVGALFVAAFFVAALFVAAFFVAAFLVASLPAGGIGSGVRLGSRLRRYSASGALDDLAFAAAFTGFAALFDFVAFVGCVFGALGTQGALPNRTAWATAWAGALSAPYGWSPLGPATSAGNTAVASHG